MTSTPQTWAVLVVLMHCNFLPAPPYRPIMNLALTYDHRLIDGCARCLLI